jgi:hypothetical protein
LRAEAAVDADKWNLADVTFSILRFIISAFNSYGIGFLERFLLAPSLLVVLTVVSVMINRL